MLRFRMIFADDVDEDFLEDETETGWEDAVCEDPYKDDDESFDIFDDEDEDGEREWCD